MNASQNNYGEKSQTPPPLPKNKPITKIFTCAKKCEFEMFKISDVNIEKRDLQ